MVVAVKQSILIFYYSNINISFCISYAFTAHWATKVSKFEHTNRDLGEIVREQDSDLHRKICAFILKHLETGNE